MTLSDDFYNPRSRVSHPSERPAWVPQPRVPSSTWSAWAIALLPLAGLAINLSIGAVQGFMTWLTIGTVSALLLALSVILARIDRRELDAWGFENTASPWLVLLTPPVYLAVRGNRVWKRTTAGFGPFWASVAVFLLTPVVLVASGVLRGIGAELGRVYELLGM